MPEVWHRMGRVTMDKMREKHLQEIHRVEEALRKTKSPFLVRDYKKHLAELKKDLRDYDRFKATGS